MISAKIDIVKSWLARYTLTTLATQGTMRSIIRLGRISQSIS